MSDFDISNIRKLDGNLMLVFNELMDCRNAKETAVRLHVSQSAISHSLARLRVLFEDELFIRKPHGLEPTLRAIQLQPKLRSMLEDMQTLVGDGSQQFTPEATRRLFRVAAPAYVAATITPAFAKRWAIRAPHISQFYLHKDVPESLSELRRGDIDLVIGRLDNVELQDSFSSQLLYCDEYCVVSRRKHPRLKSRKLSMEQYANERHVLASRQSEVTRSEWRIYPSMPAGFVVDDWSTALNVVASSDLIATCHRRLAEQFAKPLNLRLFEPPFDPNVLEIHSIRKTSADEGIEWLANELTDVT